MLQPLLPTLNTPLNIPKPSRPINLSLRIRLLGRVIITSLVLLRRSARLRVFARNLRFAGFLSTGRHVAGWRRGFVGSESGYAGECAEGEGREALVVEGGAAEGHDGCLGEEGGCGWRLHCGELWFGCVMGSREEEGLRILRLAIISHDSSVTEFGGRTMWS